MSRCWPTGLKSSFRPTLRNADSPHGSFLPSHSSLPKLTPLPIFFIETLAYVSGVQQPPFLSLQRHGTRPPACEFDPYEVSIHKATPILIRTHTDTLRSALLRTIFN